MQGEAREALPRWKVQAERGAVFWLRQMLWIARLTGRRGARLVLLPISAYYLLTARGATRASRQFLALVLGRPARLRDVARHIHCFASVILDRLFITMGRTQAFAVDIRKPPDFDRIVYGGGALLFVSHLGSFEAMRLSASERGPIKVLMDREHGRRMMAFFQAVNPQLSTTFIDIDQGAPAVALSIKQELDSGHRVGIMVDRARPGEPVVRAPFLGRPAAFPIAPWLMAATLRAPVALCFGLFEGGNRYRLEFEVFSEKLEIPRAQREMRLRECVERYARCLERQARAAPYNWFNFYDFWDETDAAR